ncbi:MAG TPA: DUF2163 domain-containing protein [Rhodocyclaceae bacterium]|nr:DUF2163 domain-containing protein [Rhodocyclaceae bacterium]
MIETTAEHIALLNSRVFWAVDLYQITFLDGTSLRLLGDTGGLSTLWNGNTFQGGGPLLTRDAVRIARGLEADDLSMTINPKADDLLLGLPWREAIQNGALDGARISLWRAHAPMPGAPIVGAVLRFSGPVNDWEVEDEIRISVKSDISKLDAPLPRAVYGPGCDRTLYTPGCDVNRTAYQTNATALPGSSPASINTGLTAAAGYYAGGEIRWITGLNAGARRTVKRQSAAGTLALTYPLNRSVTAGDSFVIWPGCAHDTQDCGGKFNNLPHFRGEPFVPAPETAF